MWLCELALAAASANVTDQQIQLSKHPTPVPGCKKTSKLFPLTHLNISCLSIHLDVLPITHYRVMVKSEQSPTVRLQRPPPS